MFFARLTTAYLSEQESDLDVHGPHAEICISLELGRTLENTELLHTIRHSHQRVLCRLYTVFKPGEHDTVRSVRQLRERDSRSPFLEVQEVRGDGDEVQYLVSRWADCYDVIE